MRVMDGDTVVGRFIDEKAYDAYLRGAILEQEGQLEEAEAAYQTAHETDPNGVAPLVRLAAVRCARGGVTSYQRAEEALAAAAKLDPTYGPMYTERARCALVQGGVAQAEQDVRKAMWLDPKDAETTVVYARVLTKTGRVVDAVRVLVGFVTWRPQAPEVWAELETLSRAHPGQVDGSILRTRPGRKDSKPGVRGAAEDLESIDRAIAGRDLPAARDRALRHALGTGAVAVRAAALGQWEVALEEAAVVLFADPWNPDARAALMSLPDLGKARQRLGEGAWGRLLAGMADPARPSPLGALVLADALKRRVGDDAARLFLQGYGEIAAEPRDPLQETLRARVVGSMAAVR